MRNLARIEAKSVALREISTIDMKNVGIIERVVIVTEEQEMNCKRTQDQQNQLDLEFAKNRDGRLFRKSRIGSWLEGDDLAHVRTATLFRELSGWSRSLKMVLSALKISLREIFDLPRRRSTKIIGTSPIFKSRREARNRISIR